MSGGTAVGVGPLHGWSDRRLPSGRPSIGYVPALDGIRGLAVMAVLAFHGGMPWARGGFLGVDAFFVLSGYLITSLLLAEWEQTGRIALRTFWVRRARRLLPALLLMVAVVMIGFRTLLPPEEVRLLRGDGLAALLYVANWRMILRGGDYFAQTASPSPLEHTWSLAIEEQFYVVWPLLMAGLLAGTLAVAARRAALAHALVLCAIGAAVSTVLLATLYRPDDPGRAYYGTDTRGASLLVGAGLAFLLARRLAGGGGLGRQRVPSRWARTALGACACLAVPGLAWAWSQASGGDAWLYRGGLLMVAVAVAVLLAHVVLVPRGWSARVLAVAPLVLVGRISYGIYLWHWPTFIALNSDRTGRQGTDLFMVRCLVTLGVAALSYLVGRAPHPRRTTPAVAHGSPGSLLSPVWAPSRLWSSRPRPYARRDRRRGPWRRIHSWRTGSSTGRPAPIPGHRAGTGPGPSDAAPSDGPAKAVHHHPLAGRDPVIVVFGDSIAWTLVRYLPSHPGLDIRGRVLLGCGVARTGPYRYFGQTYPGVGPDCREWPTLWRRAIDADDPDVAFILVGRWETMDRMLEGRWTHVGDPAFDAYLRSELELAIATAGAHGARVVLATQPYNRRGEQLDGSLYPEDEPERVTAWNALLRDVAADHPDVRVLDFGARVSPDGHFTWTAGGIQVRSDGLHLTPSGVQDWIAPWLLPQLRTAMTR